MATWPTEFTAALQHFRASIDPGERMSWKDCGNRIPASGDLSVPFRPQAAGRGSDRCE